MKPVAQPIRRTPFSLRSKVEAKIQELVDLDIIEPAQGPTTWVNPVVVVPKSGGGGQSPLHRHAQGKPGDTEREASNPHS